MQSFPSGGPPRLPTYRVDPRASICSRCCRPDARETESSDHEICCDKCGCVLASSFAHKYDDERHTGRGAVAAAGFESLGDLEIKTGRCQGGGGGGGGGAWSPYVYAGAKTAAADKGAQAADGRRQQRVTKHIRDLVSMLDLHAGLERAAIKLSVPGKGGLGGFGGGTSKSMMPKPREIAAAAVMLASEKTRSPQPVAKVADYAECTAKQLNRARRALLISRSPAKVAAVATTLAAAAATASEKGSKSLFAKQPEWHPLLGGGSGSGGDAAASAPTPPPLTSAPTREQPPAAAAAAAAAAAVSSETSVVLNKCLLAIVQGSQRIGASFGLTVAAKEVATAMWKRGLLEGSRPASIAAGAFKFAASQKHVHPKIPMKAMVAAFSVTQGTIQKHFKRIQKASKPEPMPAAATVAPVKLEEPALAVRHQWAAAELPVPVRARVAGQPPSSAGPAPTSSSSSSVAGSVRIKAEPMGMDHQHRHPTVRVLATATATPIATAAPAGGGGVAFPSPPPSPPSTVAPQQQQQQQQVGQHPWTVRSTTILRAAASLGVEVDLDLVASPDSGIRNTARKHGAHAVGFWPFQPQHVATGGGGGGGGARGGSGKGCYVEIRSSGKVSCMGARSVDEARRALGECTERIRMLTGGPYDAYLYDAAQLLGFEVQAFCLNVDFGVAIPLSRLAATLGPLSGEYDPGSFPAITYYTPIRKPMNLRIFASGKVRVNGAKSVAEAEAALAELYQQMRAAGCCV